MAADTAVGAGHHEGLLHEVAQVLFAEAVFHRAGPAAAQAFDGGIFRGDAPGLGELGNAPPLDFIVFAERGDNDVCRSLALHVLGHALADDIQRVGVLDHLAEALHAGGRHPFGQHGGRERGAGGRVGILVARHVQAGCLQFVDFRHHACRVALGLAAALEVRDVQVHARFPADPGGFIDGREDLGTLVAHVGGVDAFERRDFAGEFDNLLRVGKAAGGVDQAGGHAEGAVAHRFTDILLHPGHLLGRGFAVGVAHHLLADGAQPDEVANIGAETLGFKEFYLVRDGHGAAAAHTAEDGGHAHRQIAFVLLGLRLLHIAVDMGVRVDEARSHDLALGVDYVVGLAFGDVRLDGRNLAALDQNVRFARLGAGAVIDQTAFDKDGFLAGLRRGDRREQQHERCEKNSLHIRFFTFSYV